MTAPIFTTTTTTFVRQGSSISKRVPVTVEAMDDRCVYVTIGSKRSFICQSDTTDAAQAMAASIARTYSSTR